MNLGLRDGMREEPATPALRYPDTRPEGGPEIRPVGPEMARAVQEMEASNWKRASGRLLPQDLQVGHCQNSI